MKIHYFSMTEEGDYHTLEEENSRAPNRYYSDDILVH